MDPIVELPSLSPDQTCTVDLVVRDTDVAATVSFAITTGDGKLFGQLLTAEIVPLVKPVVLVYASPMQGSTGPLQAVPGELRTLEWGLANVGPSTWPDDMRLVLRSRTDGLVIGIEAQNMPLPAVPVGVTAELIITLVIPTIPGRFSAEWAVRSLSVPTFSHELSVEFAVSDIALPDLGVAVPAEAKEDCIVIPERCCHDKEALAVALLQIRKSPWIVQEPCYTTLVKIFGNIRSKPDEPKFRRIPKSSKRIVADVLSVPGGRDALIASGFEEAEDVFLMPSSVAFVGAVIVELQASASMAAMDWKRQERDARILMERAREKQKPMCKAVVTEEMKRTLERVKDDQDILQERLDISVDGYRVEHFLDKDFAV